MTNCTTKIGVFLTSNEISRLHPKLHLFDRIEKGYHDIFEEKYRAAEERCAMLESDLIEAHNEKAEAVRRLKEEVRDFTCCFSSCSFGCACMVLF